MDKYKVRIKNRMIFDMIGTVAFLPVAVYALIRYWNIEGVMSGAPVKDFFAGVINGVRGAAVIAFVIYLMFSFVNNLLAIRNEEKLKKMYFEEYDERALAISEHSSRVTYNITIYIILVSCIITGLYNTTISMTLLVVWIFVFLTRIITISFFNNKI